jgi:hypothetical protein
MELCWTRRPGYAGALSLEYTEIEAWCRLTQRTLSQWELKLLMEMDVAYIQALRKKDEAKKEPETPSILGDEDISTRPLTPELFDALFGSNDNRR